MRIGCDASLWLTLGFCVACGNSVPTEVNLHVVDDGGPQHFDQTSMFSFLHPCMTFDI